MAGEGGLKTEPMDSVWFNVPCASLQKCIVRLKNASPKRIAFLARTWRNGAFETNAGRRYQLSPSKGIIAVGQSVQLFLSVSAFQYDANSTKDDRIVIKWFDAPDDGGDEYNDAWMMTAPVIHQKLMSIMFNV